MPQEARRALDLAKIEPYPGLRSFTPEESHLFFGRESQTAELLNCLERQRFVAVVGDSGSGKSSLVKAGLIPALWRGRLRGTTSRWRVCTVRPAGKPISGLASELEEKELGSNFEALMRGSTLGLAQGLSSCLLEEGESILLVVDQFEELFAFATGRFYSEESRQFIANLLEAANSPLARLYIVVTMRSDFLGHCAKFAGLAAAVNRGEYLVPQMTRVQARSCIEKPLAQLSIGIAPGLVDTLLNDLGEGMSDLPFLQHVLRRMYGRLRERVTPGQVATYVLSDEDYKAVGPVEDALGKHSDSLIEELNKDPQFGLHARDWAGKTFRCLVAQEGGAQFVRHPVTQLRLYEMLNIREDRVAKDCVSKVIDIYSDNSLLVAPPKSERSRESILDIPHERMITLWADLKGWAVDEARAIFWYVRAADDSRRFYSARGTRPKVHASRVPGLALAGERRAEPRARTWRDPELAMAQEYVGSGHWNQAWARERTPGAGSDEFKQVENFLASSRRAQRVETLVRWGSLVVALAVLFLLVYGSLYLEKQRLELSNSKLTKLLAMKYGVRLNPKDDQLYLRIPPGTFTMGCSLHDDLQCGSGEMPAHQVQITKEFWLGQSEVTQRAWKQVRNAAPPNQTNDEDPVRGVTWDEASRYCEQIGPGSSLPTEAQWEYAARGKGANPRYGDIDEIAWYKGDSGGKAHKVMTKRPNDFGLHDMLGNAPEWVLDNYASYTADSATDPVVQLKSSQQWIVRGGSWNDPPAKIRATYREEVDSQSSASNPGFRCVWNFDQ